MIGRYLQVDDNGSWSSKGRHIFKSTNDGVTWYKYFSIPCSFFVRILFKSVLLSRLLRLDIHHFTLIDENNAVCVFNKEIVWLDLQFRKVIKRESIHGSRPLSFIHHENFVIYGEYRGNAERGDVHVWKASIKDKFWKPALTVTGVRHIHGVFMDPFNDEFWVTTGDENEESQVIITDGQFATIKVLIQGSQQSRIVQPLFTKHFVYFASDAPNEVNYIYRYSRGSGLLEPMQKVGGPIYFGQVVDDILFFSTVVEPSNINNQETVELWASSCGEVWKRIRVFNKDILSMRYFQYGQLIFANQLNNKYLCFSEFGTINHLRMHKLNIDELKHTYFQTELK